MKKFVYNFKEGNKDMKSLLGGKGANLAEMTNIGTKTATIKVKYTKIIRVSLVHKQFLSKCAETRPHNGAKPRHGLIKACTRQGTSSKSK